MSRKLLTKIQYNLNLLYNKSTFLNVNVIVLAF